MVSAKVFKMRETNWNLTKGHVNMDSIKEKCTGKVVLGNACCADDMLRLWCGGMMCQVGVNFWVVGVAKSRVLF